MEDLALDDDISARKRIRETLQPQAREHRMARRRADVDADRSEHYVVGLTFVELAQKSCGVDGLVVVAAVLSQAGWKTASIRDGMPRLRSSSS